MIIANGTIQAKVKTGGGIDPITGFPAPARAVRWDEPIPCQYYADRYSRVAKTGKGEPFTSAGYTILIEERPFSAEQVRLLNSAGEIIGEFPVIRTEPLEAVGEIRLTV